MIRDPLGHETRFTFDAQGRQLSRTLPLGFGEDGRKGTADDPAPGRFTESFQYDDFGRQTKHVSFEGVLTEFLYDRHTGLLSQKNFSGLPDEDGHLREETWTYRYDAFGRVVEVDQAGCKNTTAYDAEGRIVQFVSPEGTVNYRFDALGRQDRTFTGTGTNPINDTRSAYDPLGRLTTVTVVERNNVVLGAAEKTEYQYDLLGKLIQTTQPNGVVSDYAYDVLNRLDVLTEYRDLNSNGQYDAGDTPLAQYDYEVRLDGRRSQAVETFWFDSNGDGVPDAHTNTIAWDYDDLGRVTDEVFDHYDDLLDQSEHFIHDLAGNRLQQVLDRVNGDDETIVYEYDANDRLTKETRPVSSTIDRTTLYQYGPDAGFQSDGTTWYAGNWTVQTDKALWETVWNAEHTSKTVTKLEETQSTYNLQGRLHTVAVAHQSDGGFDPDGRIIKRQLTSYQYDANGNRVLQDWQDQTEGEDSHGDKVWNDSSKRTTTYLNDPQNPTGYSQVLEALTETKVEGVTTTNRVVYTIGLDQISQSRYTGSTLVGTDYFLCDGHGSTRMLVNATGAVVVNEGNPTDPSDDALQVFSYDAFGNALGFAPSIALTNHLYSGEVYDVTTQLQFLRARYYDPRIGQFITVDPYAGNKFDPQSLHKYLYVHGDPVNLVDPSGMSAIPGDVYYRVGTKVHWIFSGYVFLSGRSRTPGAYLSTILPEHFPAGSANGSLHPDLVDVTEKTYFELKPVTWSADAGKLARIQAQVGAYDAALKPLGYRRGRSKDLTFDMKKMPLGTVQDQGKKYLVSLLPARERLEPSGINGRGILWYELDELDGQDRDQKRVPLPYELAVPVDVREDIELFDFGYGSDGIYEDWVPYVGIAATYVGVRIGLYALAAQSATTVTTAYTVSIQSYMSIATVNCTLGRVA